MPFQIIRGDITKVKADAIVNTTNTEVVADARYIFNENSPVWVDGTHNEIEELRQYYDRCLNLAIQHECESIAIPSSASDIYGFPKDISLRIAIDAFRVFLSQHELEIYLVIYGNQSVRLSDEMFSDVRRFVNRKFGDTYPAAPVGSAPLMRNFSMPTMSAANVPMEPNIPKAPQVKETQKKSKKSKLFPSLLGGARPDKSKNREIFVGSVPSQPLDVYVDRFENQEILTFGEYLQQLINKKGMTNKEVYFESNLTKQYFSKLINNKVNTPAKEKLLCIAVALKLNIDETKDFLLHAGYALSPYSKIDLVFEYYIRSGKFDIYEISFALEDLGIAGGLWPELA